MADISSINGNPIVLPDNLRYFGSVPRPLTLTDFDDAEPNSVYKIGTNTGIDNMPIKSNGTLITIGTNADSRGLSQIYVTQGGTFIRELWASWNEWHPLDNPFGNGVFADLRGLSEEKASAFKVVDLYVTEDFVSAHPLPWNVLSVLRQYTYGSNTVHAIVLNDSNGTRFNVFNVLSRNYVESPIINLSKNQGLYNSACKGLIIIDWDAFDDNSSISFIGKLCSSCVHTIEEFETRIVQYTEDPYPYKSKQEAPFNAIKDLRIKISGMNSASVMLNSIVKDYHTSSNPSAPNAVVVQGQLYDINRNSLVGNLPFLNKFITQYEYANENEFSLNVGGVNVSGSFYIDWSAIDDGTFSTASDAWVRDSCITYEDSAAETQPAKMLALPSLFAVVGKTYYLRHHNMTKWIGQDRGQIYGHNGNQIQNQGDRLKVSPSTTGVVGAALTLNKDEDAIQSHTLYVNAVADNAAAAPKALFIGDSMTEQKYYLAELVNMLPSMELFGTRSGNANDSTDTQRLVRHEGRSSWSAYEYTTVSEKNGVTNAFWNPSTSSFDFSYYISQNNISGLTDVFILLGTNDTGSASNNSRYITAMNTIVSSIEDYDSSIQIHIILAPPPIDDGYGWGTRNNSNVQTWKNSMFDLWELVISNFNDYDIIPAGLNVDCWYDFPHTTVQVNERNPATAEVGNENVHPSRYGYYNMADVIYAHIIGTR